MTFLKVTSASQAQAIDKSDLVPILDTWTLLLSYSCHVGKKFEIYLGKQTDGTQNSRAEIEMLFQHSKKIATLKLHCTLLARSLLAQGRPTVTDVCAQYSYWLSCPLAVLQHSSFYYRNGQNFQLTKICLSALYFWVKCSFGGYPQKFSRPVKYVSILVWTRAYK